MACDTFTAVMLSVESEPDTSLATRARTAPRETSVRARKAAGKVLTLPCFTGLGAMPAASGALESYEDFMGFSEVFPLL
jgi:hypothetical protein